MAFFHSKEDMVSEGEKGKYRGDGLRKSSDSLLLLHRNEDPNPFGYRRKKRFLLCLAIKVFISLIAVLLCTATLTWLLPDGRGAGSRYLREISEKRKTQALLMWAAQPGGQAADKLKEAAALVPFTLKFPTYLPDQAELVEVVLNDSKSYGIKFIYEGPDISLVITQREISEGVVSVALDINHHQGEFNGKEISICSYNGIVTSDKEGNMFLSFVDDRGIHFTMFGKLNEEEMIRIAYSLRP